MDNSKQPAFPNFLQEGLTHNSHVEVGLTKREHFAGLAMQGLLSNPDFRFHGGMSPEEQITKSAIGYADELLKQLEAK